MNDDIKPPPPPPPAQSLTKASIQSTLQEEGKRWQDVAEMSTKVAEMSEAMKRIEHATRQNEAELHHKFNWQQSFVNQTFEVVMSKMERMKGDIMKEIESVKTNLESLKQDFDERNQFVPVPDLQIINGKQNVNPYKLRFA